MYRVLMRIFSLAVLHCQTPLMITLCISCLSFPSLEHFHMHETFRRFQFPSCYYNTPYCVLASNWSFFLAYFSVCPSPMISVSSTKSSANSFYISPDMVVFVSRIWPSFLIYPISLYQVHTQSPGPTPLPFNIPWSGFFLDSPKDLYQSPNRFLGLNITACISSILVVL